MKKLISTALISLLMVLLTGYVFAQDMMEKSEKPCYAKEAKSEKSEMKDEAKPCPMHEKMMQEKGEIKDMRDKPMMEGKMICPMCKMMKEGKMCPMHEKMMQQMHGGMMGGMGMMQGMGPDMMPGFHERIFQLDLSREQKEQINHFFNFHKEEMERLQSERQRAEMEMNEVSKQDMPDLRHVRGLVQRIADLEADMKYSRIRVMVEAKSVLKEEQRANLRRKMEGKSMDKPIPKAEEKPDMPGHEGHKM